jgi:hypothetical protein
MAGDTVALVLGDIGQGLPERIAKRRIEGLMLGQECKHRAEAGKANGSELIGHVQGLP